MKRIVAVSILFVTFLILSSYKTTHAASFSWNWDDGTTQEWIDGSGGTILTLEPGRNGTFGLGAQQPLPYIGSIFPQVKIENQIIDPASLVGGEYGNYLNMTGEIYVDIDRAMNPSRGYLDLWIFGENSYARFHTYPSSNMGEIEDLNDGWYRHYLVNRFHFEYSGWGYDSSWAGTIKLAWNWDNNATNSPVVFDNFYINSNIDPVPEPTTMLLLGTGLIGLAGTRRKFKK